MKEEKEEGLSSSSPFSSFEEFLLKWHLKKRKKKDKEEDKEEEEAPNSSFEEEESIVLFSCDEGFLEQGAEFLEVEEVQGEREGGGGEGLGREGS